MIAELLVLPPIRSPLAMTPPAGAIRFRTCQTLDDLRTTLLETSPQAVLVEAKGPLSTHKRALLQMLVDRPPAGSVVLAISASAATDRDVRQALDRLEGLRVIIWTPTADHRIALAERALALPPSASATMISSLAPLVSGRSLHALVGAILLGERRATVAQLAGLCELSARTIERHLAAAGLPTASALLGISTSLHAAWRIEMCGLSVRQAAAIAGFNSSAALCNIVRRHTQRPLGDLARAGGFGVVLEALMQRVLDRGVRDGHRSPSRSLRRYSVAPPVNW